MQGWSTVRQQANGRARALDRESGAGTLEVLGVVGVAAVLVTGAIVGISHYPEHIAAALCQISQAIDGGSQSCEAPTPTEPGAVTVALDLVAWIALGSLGSLGVLAASRSASESPETLGYRA